MSNASSRSPSPAPVILDRLSRVVIVGIALFALLGFLYAYMTGKPLALRIATLAASAAVLGCLRLGPLIRINLALTGLGALFALYGAELWFTFGGSSATVRHALAEHFDTRPPLQVVDDFRRAGVDAHSNLFGRLPMVYGQNNLSTAEGALLPIGGISNRFVVFCNESGEYVTYRSDEHGFNNPPGLWSGGRVDVMAIGDSFAQGVCVSADRSIVGQIRRRYPATLNLGMAGSGPLLELAALEEYGPRVKPRIVLWFFFEANDYVDLAAERGNPMLMHYLQRDRPQDLIDRQSEIDAAWLAYEEELRTDFRRRHERPFASLADWLNDVLVEHRNRRAAARILRLREVRARVQARLAPASHEEEQLPLLGAVLANANAQTEAWGGRLYVVALPGLEVLLGRSPVRERMYSLTLEKAHSLGIETVDVRAGFGSTDPLSLFFYPDSHYNPAGAELAARAVLSSLPSPAAGAPR